jgi:hypothetical protein
MRHFCVGALALALAFTVSLALSCAPLVEGTSQ